jgi:ABC transporter transmembrane region 2
MHFCPFILEAYFYKKLQISLVNNVLKYGIAELKFRMRTRLTHHLYDQYLRYST